MIPTEPIPQPTMPACEEATYHDRQRNIPISCDFWQRLRKLVNWIADNWEQADEETGSTGEHVGNFLQAFTHLVLISATDILDRALGAERIKNVQEEWNEENYEWK